MTNSVLTIFTLASGRSGTHFLYQLFRRNAADCCCRHEPYGFNPSMFGRPIYDRAVGDTDAIRKLAERKARIIRRCGQPVYVETSHAFLKSWSDVAAELFPDLKLVHLVRDPLKVAKSEANRHQWLDWFHFPLRNYRGGDGRLYPRWALTTLEPIYQAVGCMSATKYTGSEPAKAHGAFRFTHAPYEQPLTLFQRYVIQWIEIENRAMRFLDRFNKHADCITLQSPHELNDAARVRKMFDFLGVKLRRPAIDTAGRQNRNPRPTVITDREREEFAAVVARLPPSELAIFHKEPYAGMRFLDCLRIYSSSPPFTN
ncbi:MAG: hypothetical protein L0211_07330 [Planctomycetaceae bacterium]|nr:hypothetical protein [Planctomycetaceae bacterium]